jgi:hypothetical protein
MEPAGHHSHLKRSPLYPAFINIIIIIITTTTIIIIINDSTALCWVLAVLSVS